MKHSLLVFALLAGGCATQGKLDNVLTVTLAEAKPRAFLNSTYWSLSVGAELREQDAQALADLLRIKAQYDMLMQWMTTSKGSAQ